MPIQLNTVIAGLILSAAAAVAHGLTVVSGNVPQPDQSNVIRNACGLDDGSAEGTTILGCLNDDHAQLVLLTSDESIRWFGGGQSRIRASSGLYSQLEVSAADSTLTSVILNLNVSADGFVSFSDGTATSSLFEVDANGQNFFTITGLSGDLSLMTFSDALGTESDIIQDTRQIRLALGGPVPAIPESNTYALLMAGLGALCFVARRRIRTA
jgi:hypothetical protein